MANYYCVSKEAKESTTGFHTFEVSLLVDFTDDSPEPPRDAVHAPGGDPILNMSDDCTFTPGSVIFNTGSHGGDKLFVLSPDYVWVGVYNGTVLA